MAKALTAKTIENFKAGEGRREVPDGGCRGLYFIIQPSGRRSWAVRYRFLGKSRKLTLDSVTSLTDARRSAATALHEVEQGRDPAASKVEAKAAAAADTIERWATAFIERHAKKQTRKSSWTATVSIFNRIILPAWQGRTVHDIRRRDVIDLVEGVAEDRPIMANRTLAALSKWFRWLASRDVVIASPCVGVSPPGKEKIRKRSLSDDEIVRFWHACGSLPAPFDNIYRLLLLIGARRQELAEMRWSEISERDRIWTLPDDRSKNREDHTVPLSRQAWGFIAAQPRIIGSDFVFGRRRSGFSHFKPILDAEMRLNAPWVTHDLRRTLAAGMQRLGVETRTIEAVLGHKPRGIIRVYQVHEFDAEKREALQKWADYVEQLVGGFEP